jgi:hypothetical protein
MEEKQLQRVFLALVRAELTDTPIDDAIGSTIKNEMLPALFCLAKKHDLAHMIAPALRKRGLLSDPSAKAHFERAEMMATYRHTQMQYAFAQICDLFDRYEIPYIPLKGAVLRPFYRKETMRTSCDIDILIHETNLQKAVCRLEEAGFTAKEKSLHDISLYSQEGIHLELHFNLLENVPHLDAVLEEAWSHATHKAGFCYEFTPAFFLFHLFAHMSYHFMAGGCGVRSLTDLFVAEHEMHICCDDAKELLARAKIDTFACEMTRLCDAVFSQSAVALDAFFENVLSYICYGGVYGNEENKAAVKKARTNSTVKYALGRIFLPYRTMKVRYPILKKLPILLPFCWIGRFFSILFTKKGRRVARELETRGNVTAQKVLEMKEMQKRLGL